MTDAEYIRGFASNDNRVLRRFERNFRGPFIAYLRSKTGKSTDYLENIFQEAWVRLWQNVTSGRLTESDLTASLSTYFNQIGYYTYLETERKYKEVISNDALKMLDFLEDDAEQLQKRIERETFVDNAVSEMGSPCSQLLSLFYFERKSGEEIAEVMGYANTDTVKTAKYKCVQKLKPLFKMVRSM